MAKILIGITGSIAAYKSIELASGLTKLGHEVRVILTDGAEKFVTKVAFLAFSIKVYSDNGNAEEAIQHISLARWPDMFIIVPLSANTLSKISYGFGDNLLTTTVLATSCRVYLVPAMNMYMWQNRIIQENVKKLEKHNYVFWGPTHGLQACGDNGVGRMLEVDEVVTCIEHALLVQSKNFMGLKVVITLGATKELLDPIRFISNNSSGKMGLALAHALSACNARVQLIVGTTQLKISSIFSNIEYVTSAKDMLDKSIYHVKNSDVFIGCAAVTDYTVAKYQTEKIKKKSELAIQLIKTEDIVATVKKLYPQIFVVGFAAETNDLIKYAMDKLKKKNLDLVVANDVANGKVFGLNESEVIIIDKNLNQAKVGQAHKNIIAHEILKYLPNK